MNSIDPAALSLVANVRRAYPDLEIVSARRIIGEGQFNQVLVVNEQLIFRFPRTADGAATLAREIALLARLQGRLPLPIPNPIYQIADPATGIVIGGGYRMLPGRPLWNEALDAINDEPALDRLAGQLGSFLRSLHAIPIAESAPDIPARPAAVYWADLHAQFRALLYPHMRADACRDVDVLFADIAGDLQRMPPAAVLCHGDFGGGNILYDPETLSITGIIDFGFAGVGDPAGDIASLSCSGEAFLVRGFSAYPEMEAMLPRARRYRETFALQQALYALQTDSRADFDDGIQQYI